MPKQKADLVDEPVETTEPELTIAAKEPNDQVLINVLRKTGAALAGATTLVGKATESEKEALLSCVQVGDNVYEISDSKGWRSAMNALAVRLSEEQKASVDSAESEPSHA